MTEVDDFPTVDQVKRWAVKNLPELKDATPIRISEGPRFDTKIYVGRPEFHPVHAHLLFCDFCGGAMYCRAQVIPERIKKVCFACVKAEA